MRGFSPVLLCLYLVNIAQGQESYCEINLESNKIDGIQAFEVHDSVFLTYTDRDMRKAFWIDHSGKTSQVFLNHVGQIRICGIQKQSDTTFLYYLKEEDKFLRLYALKQASHGGNVYSGGKSVTIFGEIIATHFDDGEAIMVYYLKKSNRIEILSLSRGIKTGFVDLQMPADFSRFASSSGFITNKSLTGISQGAAPTKIYREGGSMVITIDENRSAVGKSVTRIIKIDLSTGKHILSSIPGPDQDKFRSFYHEGKLFQFITDPIYQWVVYDIESGALLYTKKLEQEKSLRDEKVVVRTESPEVLFGSLYRMMDFPGDPSIIVEIIPGTSDLRIVSGTFQNSKGVALGGAGAMTPLGLLAGLIVANVINQLEPPPGIQQYFYLKGNAEQGFDFEPLENKSAPTVRQIIDDYEMSRTSAVPKGEEKWSWFLLYKGYLELQDGALGIYHEKRKDEKKLILLKYRRDTGVN